MTSDQLSTQVRKQTQGGGEHAQRMQLINAGTRAPPKVSDSHVWALAWILARYRPASLLDLGPCPGSAHHWGDFHSKGFSKPEPVICYGEDHL